MMKKFLLLATITAAVITALSSCSNDDEPAGTDATPTPREDIELSRAESAALSAQDKFAFSLFKALCNNASMEESVLVSPLSVGQDLSMLANGAKAEALTELTTLLGVTKNDLDALNSLNANLCEQLPLLDNQTTLSLANSTWISPDYQFKQDFVNTLAKNYNAYCGTADLTTQHGVNVVNQWISNATRGNINNMIDDPMPAVFAFVNALYFNGKWATPFNEANTKRSSFKPDGGISQHVMMMESDGSYQMGHCGDFYVLRLPYGNGAFRMNIILPDGKATLSDVIAGMDETSYHAAMQSLEPPRGLTIKLPRFTMAHTYNLLEILKTLGLNKTLSDDCQDLTGILSKDSAIITKILASTTIEVNESGTKAAAATVIGGMDGSVGKSYLYVDRSFMFVIDEVSTGAILFMGAVNTIE